LTSQRSGQKGDFKAQERAVESATGLTDDDKTIEETGASALLVEAVPLKPMMLYSEHELRFQGSYRFSKIKEEMLSRLDGTFQLPK